MAEVNAGLLREGQARSTVLLNQLLQYGVALLSVALALGTTSLLGSYLEPTPTPLFFAAVIVSAWYGGLKPGIVATILSTLAINYFLLEPIHELNISNPGTLVRLGVFVMTALLINSLNEAQRTARRRAEANFNSLRESEARFGCLAESNIIGTIVAELDGKILDANNNFLQLVGYTQEELRTGHLHWRKMTPPELIENSEKAVRELLATGVCTPFEKQYIRKDGSRVPVLQGAVMTGAATVTSFVLDLSEHKRLEAIQQEAMRRERSLHAEVQAANTQLETVLASLNDQFLVLDQEWRYIYVSERVIEIVGRSRQELLGKCIWDVFPETVGGQFYTEVHRAAAEQSVVRFEYFYSPWQRWFENHVYPSAAGVSILVTDITDRKRAEESLQRTNQTLQTLLDACPVAIAFFDPQGIVRLWNRAAERIFGWSAAEAIGQFMPTVSHRPEAFLDSIQTVLSGRSIAGLEAQHQRKDGQRVDLEIWANLTYDAEGNPGCLGIAWDITERKQAEAILRTSEERYRLLVTTTTAVVWTATAEGGFICTQPSWEVYTGQRWEEYAGWGWLEMFHPDDREELAARWNHALTERSFYEAEGRLWHAPSGQYRHILARAVPLLNADGSVREWIGMDTDIHDRKQAEEALRHSEERLRVALKNSPISVFNQDQALRYTWIYNPTPELHATEIIGKQDADLFSTDDVAGLTAIKQRVLETGFAAREEVKLTLEGQDFYYDMTVEPLLDSDGETIAITCACIDITDRKQMELALRQSETTLSALISSSPIGIAFFDRDLRYIHANEALAESNGIPLSEHLGRTLWDVLPEWAPVFAPVLQQVMAAQKPLLNQEVVGVTHPSDLVRYALVNYFPVCLPDGQVLGVGVTSVDISDRKRFEDERRRVQQELQQTLQTLQTVVAASPLSIVVIEPDMTVRLWNAAAEQLFGWSEAELLGQPLPIVPAEKQEECRQLQEAVTHGEVFLGVETYRCKRDGSKVILNLSAAPLHDDHHSVNAILLILQDITQQQQAQAALRDSEERLRLALMAANQGLYDLNVQTGDALVSPAYAEMLGYDPHEFQETNAKWRDRLHPDDVATVYQAYEDYVSGKLDTYRVEFRQRTQSGNWKWILSVGRIVSWDSEGQPLRMLGTHTDINERKQAEDALRQSEERLRLALDAGCLGAWEWNLETNVQQWDVNQYKLFGMDKDKNQLSADAFFQFIHPDDLLSARQLTEQVLEQGGSFHTEFRIITLDGSVRWLSSQGIVVQDSNNQPLRMIGVNFDITERKQDEEERERLLINEQAARQEAEAANRIKDEFLAVLSHELRSPLNPILGWSKLLQTQKFDEQKTQQALATIERNAKLQTQLIEDLLDVSRILRGKFILNIAPVNLIGTLEAALETVRLAVEAKGIHIQRTFNPDVAQVMGDAARLQQVIWNLLTNAVKFTPSGGTIEICLEQSNSHIQIQVKDTGKGINPKFLPHVFDYFRQEDGTTTRKFGGLGLGLAIVRHITELHGGTVQAESLGEGLGATFTVQLPLMPISASVDEKDESPTTANLSGLRILAVDDDEDIRTLIEFVLEQAGAEVRVVTSAAEALEQLEAFSPQILISDIGMPDFDGYMLMRQIRALVSAQGMIPAIALTAYAGEIDQQQAIAAGFQMHLAKPVEPEKLISAIVDCVANNS